MRLALRLPKYICTKLLHDSSGLLYVKDRLLSCASKSLDRIAQNPLVEESISSNRFNPAWDRFLTPLSAVRPVSLYFSLTRSTGVASQNASLSETGSPAYKRTRLAQSSDLEFKTNTD